MTIKELNDSVKKALSKYYVDSPALTAGILLCHVLKCDKAYLFTHYDQEVSNYSIKELELLTTRLCNHEPIDYIIGERYFMGYPFKVGRGVLIPRPETELLVEKCINFANQIHLENKEIRILDLCTGSGCIAISIVRMLKENEIFAIAAGIDISKEAIDYAMDNSRINGTKDSIVFEVGDAISIKNLINQMKNKMKLNNKDYANILNEIHVKKCTIMSINPPYIPSADIIQLDKKVRDYEPVLALDGGRDGLFFYRKIIAEAPELLEKNGMLALEIGFNQGEDVMRIIEETEFYYESKLFYDFSGLERVITCRLK